MNKADAGAGRLGLYTVLVFLLAVPFWLAGMGGRHLLGEVVPIDLPVSALSTFVPAAVAIILVGWDRGWSGVATFLGRVVDIRRIQDCRWLLPAILLMPSLLTMEYGLMAGMGWTMRHSFLPIAALPLYFAVFFIGAVGEELGWQGYAVPSLKGRHNALQIGLIVGLIWAAWHIPAYMQTHHSAEWVAWQCAQTVLGRVLMVWLSNNAGQSTFVVIVFHTMINVSEFMFPNYGSYYDPFVNTLFIGATVGWVLFLWGPQTLSRFRFARS